MRIKRQQLLTAAQIARESMERNRVPGLAMALLCDGEPVQMETLGLADPARNRPVTMQTHFEAASLTKPAFAYLVFRLVDAGVLALDVPLREYWLEGLPTEDPRFASATAAHVLSHATGLPNWGPLPLPLSFAPGTGFQYSGSGYTFLQQVVERRTGRRLDDLMQAEMLDPFGMEDAALIWTRPLNRTLAATWDDAGVQEPQRKSARHTVGLEPNAAFSLYVTIADYPKFLAQLLAEPAFAARVRAVRNPAGHGVTWGLGWGLYEELLWHWGDNGGFKSFVCFDPDTRDALLIHTNGANGLSTCFDVAAHCTGFDFSNIAAMVAGAE